MGALSTPKGALGYLVLGSCAALLHLWNLQTPPLQPLAPIPCGAYWDLVSGDQQSVVTGIPYRLDAIKGVVI